MALSMAVKGINFSYNCFNSSCDKREVTIITLTEIHSTDQIQLFTNNPDFHLYA